MISGQYIKKLAENAGFDLCGITPCKHLAENESYFREWLAKGYGSSLEYLERNLDKRFDVRHLVEGAQTVVVCAVSYKNPLGEGYPPGCRTKIASYARSRDYHPVLKGMLGTMLEALRRQYPGLTGRTFVDTAPLLEKQLAVEAGLGWIGRQSLAAHAPIRLLCPAGRVGTYPAVRPVRCPVRRSPLRPLPELPGQLSDGSHRRAQGDRHEPLHLLSYDRKGVRQRPARPRRMDLRLRSLPELLSPQPKSPHAPLAAFRSPVRPADDFGSGVARNERRGVSPAVRQYTSRTQRTAAHPAKRADKPGKERRVGPAIGRRGRQQTDPKHLRILSAGCSGNLPYAGIEKPKSDRQAHRHRPGLQYKSSGLSRIHPTAPPPSQ